MTSPAKSLQNYSSLKLAKTPGLNAPDIYLKVQNLWGHQGASKSLRQSICEVRSLLGSGIGGLGGFWPMHCGRKLVVATHKNVATANKKDLRQHFHTHVRFVNGIRKVFKQKSQARYILTIYTNMLTHIGHIHVCI